MSLTVTEGVGSFGSLSGDHTLTMASGWTGSATVNAFAKLVPCLTS